MGASVSSATSEATSSVITESVNQCKKGVASNELYLSGITHSPSPACPNPTFDVSQSAAVDAECFINSLQNNLVSNVSKLTADAQAGIGIASSNTSTVNRQNLSSKLENICAGASSTNLVSAKDITSHACNMTFVQNASAKTKCKIDAVQDAVVKSDSQSQSTGTGASLGSLLFGGGTGGIVFAVVAFLVLIVVGWFLWKRYGSKADAVAQKGGLDGLDRKNYSMAIILAILILIAIIVT